MESERQIVVVAAVEGHLVELIDLLRVDVKEYLKNCLFITS